MIVKKFLNIKHKFVKNTNMSNTYTLELTGPQFPAGIGEPLKSGPDTGQSIMMMMLNC
jgi:hypothetical protein